MADERWERVELLVTAAQALDPEEQAAFLNGLADPDLRHEVESLLAAEDGVELLTLKKSTAIHPIGRPNTKSPSRVGPYHILREIGEGGMGVVYEAEQEKPVRRKVALKLIKWGMDTKAVVARFESERQALALMNHPTIASVFDAGATDEGRPYFAMEYVQGIPITEYCDKHRLTIKERLQLFIQVCEGVQHAHQKGIIHRDIKPSNVLVAAQVDTPNPKIIDFGVAKATSQRLTEHTVATELGQLVGTPEYMSPEQAEMTNLDIDTRTDVYSLGAVLYELLVGAQPFDPKELRAAGLIEIQRKLREDEPPRPSTRVSGLGVAATTSASNRHVEVRTLVRQLRGDLDWITMKALEKDRTRRYETANALALDAERYLRNEPIHARAPSLLYLATRFVSRHRLGVGVVAAGVLFLTAFVIALARERNAAQQARLEAEREAAKARAINEFLQETFGAPDPNEGTGRDVTVVEALNAAVVKLGESFKEDPETGAALRTAIGSTYTSLGRYEDARPLLEKALETRRNLNNGDKDLTDTMSKLADLYWYEGRLEDAEPLYRELVEERRSRLGGENPETLRAQFDLASLYILQERWNTAEQLTVDTLNSQRRVLGEDAYDTWATRHNLASIYYREGRYTEAEPLAVAVLEAHRRIVGNDHPYTLDAVHNLATIYDAQSRYDLAAPLYVEAVEGRARALGEAHDRTIQSRQRFAQMLMKTKQYEGAESQLMEALQGIETSVKGEHPVTDAIVRSLVELYELWGKPEKVAEYRALLEEAEQQ